MATGKRTEAEAIMADALASLPEDPQNTLIRAECLTRYSEFGFCDERGRAHDPPRGRRPIALLDSAPVTASRARIDAQAALAYGYYLDRQNAKADPAYAAVMKALEQTRTRADDGRRRRSRQLGPRPFSG